MKFINLFIIIMSLYIAFLIFRRSTLTANHTARSKRRFWDRENEANNVRRADISALDYIRLDLNALPLQIARELEAADLVNSLEILADKKIINLSAYTNTDLKMMYGPANLDELSEYDNNYLTLIRLINSLGDAMLEKEDTNSAKTFYEYGISIGSDISNTYVKLGQIYLDNNDSTSFDKLIKRAKNLESLSGPMIITKLNNIKSDAK